MTTTDSGPDAASYAGMKVPMSDDFIRLIRQKFSPEIIQDVPQRTTTRDSDRLTTLQARLNTLSQQQGELEKYRWTISVTSQPATVPGGAKMLPTGTKLTLHCLKGDQQLSSMNFAEKQDFIWQPGQCSGVTLSVLFPDFTAHYQLEGDDAWPWFISQLTDGHALLNSDEFGDSASMLQLLDIKQIRVGFTLSSPAALETAWQNWNTLSSSMREINEQIASLDERADPLPLQPVSIIPENIAQCQ